MAELPAAFILVQGRLQGCAMDPGEEGRVRGVQVVQPRRHHQEAPPPPFCLVQQPLRAGWSPVSKGQSGQAQPTWEQKQGAQTQNTGGLAQRQGKSQSRILGTSGVPGTQKARVTLSLQVSVLGEPPDGAWSL